MNIKLKSCPICGRDVDIHGGVEEWKPTFYDPDSGGDPYYIHCECGLEFSIGYCESTELAEAWNTRIPMEQIINNVCCLRNENDNTDFKRGCNSALNEIGKYNNLEDDDSE